MTKFLRRARLADFAWDLALLALVLAIGDAIAGLFSGIGYRLDLWDYRDGIGALRYVFWLAAGVCAAAAAAVILGIVCRSPGAIACGCFALAIAAITAYIPWSLREQLNRVPPIHDISTDTINPPQYAIAGKLRKKGEHTLEYDGPEVAALQKKGYPDIGPIVLRAPAERVFEESRLSLAGMGLQLLDVERAQGRIEATDTSLLFGFGDDIVVRISPGADGTTRVDVRSKSRVGRSDLGINADRIRAFSSTLRKRMAAAPP